jgi:hypothetical protein
MAERTKPKMLGIFKSGTLRDVHPHVARQEIGQIAGTSLSPEKYGIQDVSIRMVDPIKPA